MKHIELIVMISLAVMAISGCNKFLDEKTDKKLVVPSKLDDLQALMDSDNIVSIVDPGEGEIASDNYYLTEDVWASLQHEYDRRAYTWQPDFSTTSDSWVVVYRNVYYANIILEKLRKITANNEQDRAQRDNIAGQAYFMRARGHLVAQLIWSEAYDDATADSDLGIPLRLSSDFNIESVRSSNRKVYAQIIDDLTQAAALLPHKPLHVLRASKPAAHALLARTFLFMRNYEKCFAHADTCLALSDRTLINYNAIDHTVSYPIQRFNEEVIHHSVIRGAHQPLRQSTALVDTNLYASYHKDDLRKMIFFKDNGNGTYAFKGNYSGYSSHFGGIALDEVFLMRAECHARKGNLESSMADLNILLTHRYKEGNTVLPFAAETADQALNMILNERRKELLFRGLRFPDVKRLNKEGADITFTRHFESSDLWFTLPANDPRFALPIAEEVLERAPALNRVSTK